VVIDSTGLKVSYRCEWLRDKWHVDRGWIKGHMPVEVGSGILVGEVQPLAARAQDIHGIRKVLL
jgi:hypothetical protein